MRAHVISRLDDQNWSIYQSSVLYRVVDETILGIDFIRSESKNWFKARVFIRPLYWPRPFFAYGLWGDLGLWLGSETQSWRSDWIYEGSPPNTDVIDTLNKKVIPLFARFHDGESILRYHHSHPFDPFLSFRRTLSGALESAPECLGYIAAWSGRYLEARVLLGQARHSLRGGTSEGLREARAHMEETLALLGRPEHLRSWLAGTAASVRAALKLL